MLLKIILISTSFLLTVFSVIGQNYSSSSRRAINAFEEALTAYQNHDYRKAEEMAEIAVKRDAEFIEALFLLSDIYEGSQKFEQQANVLQKVLKLNTGKDPLILTKLIDARLKTGEYSQAKEHIQILEIHKLSDANKAKLKQQKTTTEFALQAIQNPTDFQPENCGGIINSPHDDYFPAITVDGLKLYKTVNLPTGRYDALGNEFLQEDLFVTTRLQDGTPIETSPLPKEINTPGNEGAFSVAQDGQTIFFTVCAHSRGNSYHGKITGSCDIFIAEFVGSHISISNPGTPLNSSYWDSQPSFSSDGKTLYFVSRRPGGHGKSDIWKSEKLEDNNWSKPENLGSTINTAGNERTPFIHTDGRTLYFSSDGHPGMGGLDIFVSRKDQDGNWTEPKNLGYPINTHADEMGLIVDASGDSAYFSSQRADTHGGLDIYRFALTDENKPQETYFIAGRVFNRKNNASLQATLKLFNTETGQLRATTRSNINGEYIICINAGDNYAFHVNKQDYMFYSDQFLLKETEKIDDKFIRNIPLSPIEMQQTVILKNVFFDTDSFNIRSDSYPELNQLVQFLEENPDISIEISGHTDDRGSVEYNKQLSEKRALSIYQYLQNAGIKKERLQYKGYGSARPIADNDTPENRQKNRRTEFTIINSR